MAKQIKPIIIFDSGVGGLTIYQEVKRALPALQVIYCSDNAGFPYGPRPEAEVIDRTCYYLAELTRRHDPALVVIACNTASTVALPRLRQIVSVPVVGVVPAIKTAAQRSRKRCIGLLATPGTVRRAYTDQLIRTFASDCQVIRVGSAELVTIAEQSLHGEPVDQGVLAAILAPFFTGGGVDVIVLGCTHFPLLRAPLQAAAPYPVDWVDSGAAIARRVCFLLDQVPEQGGQGDLPDRFFCTGALASASQLAAALETMGFSRPVVLTYPNPEGDPESAPSPAPICLPGNYGEC